MAVFILMIVCASGITALQFYYSWVNYKTERIYFERKANEALVKAADTTLALHRENAVKQFTGWMKDTTFVCITCYWDGKNKATVYKITDQQPTDGKRDEVRFSINETGNRRFDSLTPEAGVILMRHMEKLVRNELKKGVVWYYTQQIGRRLDVAYIKTPLKKQVLEQQYRNFLKKEGISAGFKLSATSLKGADFVTERVNFNTNKANEEWLRAYFFDSTLYMLKQIKWILAGSFALLLITLGCFIYTARILLSQHRLNRIKDDFISNMTHEIHTPLSSLMVTAEAIRRFKLSPQEQQGYADIIYRQSQTLVSLTDEILNGARLEKQGIQPNGFHSANALLNELSAQEEYKDVEFTFLAGDKYIGGNKLHLVRSVANLLDNAVKYNTNENPRVRVRTLVRNKKLVIAVSDNGPGIADVDKVKVFESFYRVHSGNVHDVKGYGLGLSYVKKVAEAHGGSVVVIDNIPKGSIFEIVLPL